MSRYVLSAIAVWSKALLWARAPAVPPCGDCLKFLHSTDFAIRQWSTGYGTVAP